MDFWANNQTLILTDFFSKSTFSFVNLKKVWIVWRCMFRFMRVLLMIRISQTDFDVSLFV